MDVSDLLRPHQRAALAEIARVTEPPAARQIGVPQPDGLTVVPAKHRFEARGLLIRLCFLPTNEQKRLFALELFPLEYLHDGFENLSPPLLDASHVQYSHAPGGSTPDRARGIPAPQHREQKTPKQTAARRLHVSRVVRPPSDLRASLPH